jgi:hypothetical protein
MINIPLNKPKNRGTKFFGQYTIAVLFTVLVAALTCIAQQPFVDAKGNGTLLINGGGFAQVNISDPSIRFGYLYDNSKNDWTFGINLSGKLSGNRAGFINNNRVAPDAQVNFTIGKKYLSKGDSFNKIPVNQQMLVEFREILQKNKFLDMDAGLPSVKELQMLLHKVNLLSANENLPDPIYLSDYLTRISILTNDKIKELAEKGSSDQDIIAKIKTFPTKFDLKPEAITALEALSKDVPDPADRTRITRVRLISDAVITEMIEAPKIEYKFCKLKGEDISVIKDSKELKKFVDAFARLVFQGGYGFRQYNLYDANLSLDKQVYKKDFHSPMAQLIYFRLIGGNKLLGASVGVERSNNSSDLTEVDVRDFTSTLNNGTIREVGRTKKALRGNFMQATRAFINTDFAWFPRSLNSRIGVNFFTRSGLTGFEKGFRPGVGIFFSEKGAPTRAIGGVSVSWEKDKPNVGLIAGFNF